MARAKKDGEKISFYVDRHVMEDLRAYADEKGQTVTLAMERILRAYLDKEKALSENSNEERRDNKG